MTESLIIFGFVVTALVASLLGSAFAQDQDNSPLNIKGSVYCDPCHVEFGTSLSRPIKGALVKLECRSRLNNTVSLAKEVQTDDVGYYTITVEGDHEEEICEIKVKQSPDPECDVNFKTVDKARVLITHNVGVVDNVRYANALGFKTKTVDSRCAKVLQDMGYLPEYGFY